VRIGGGQPERRIVLKRSALAEHRRDGDWTQADVATEVRPAGSPVPPVPLVSRVGVGPTADPRISQMRLGARLN